MTVQLYSDASEDPVTKMARRLDEMQRQIDQLGTARTAEHTSVGAEGMRFHSGGGIDIDEGGAFRVRYPSGNAALLMGDVVGVEDGSAQGFGMLIQDDADTDVDRRDIFRAREHPSGGRQVFIGEDTGDSAGAVASAKTWALDEQHNAYSLLRLQSHDDADIEILSDGRLWLYGDDDVDIDCPNGTLIAQAGADAALGGDTGTFLQPVAGAGDAEVRMDSATGRITYSLIASTRRVKRDIQDLAVDPAAVLQMRPRSWLPVPAVQQCPDWVHKRHADPAECCAGEPVETPADDVRQVGFVAEELDELGLTQFVRYDAEGLPSAIHYDRLTAALIPVIRAQQAQIDALTARVAALETAAGPDLP